MEEEAVSASGGKSLFPAVDPTEETEEKGEILSSAHPAATGHF
jgi:hypothetical protein